jgi:hypothetical protein
VGAQGEMTGDDTEHGDDQFFVQNVAVGTEGQTADNSEATIVAVGTEGQTADSSEPTNNAIFYLGKKQYKAFTFAPWQTFTPKKYEAIT